jgi:hypothetical protein
MIQLRKYQIVLTNPDHSKPIQELLFANGYEWPSNRKSIKDASDIFCLYVNEETDGSIRYDAKDDMIFTNDYELHFSCNILANPDIVSTWDGAKKGYPKDADGNELIPRRHLSAEKRQELYDAFKAGKKIEYYNESLKNWQEKEKFQERDVYFQERDVYFFEDTAYRIAEPEHIPFTFEDREMFRGKYVRFKGGKPECYITDVLENCIYLSHIRCSYEEAFEKLEFIDGTPFGKVKP